MDISVGLMDSDKMLISMLTDTTKPFVLVLTKADRPKDKEIQKALDDTANFIKTNATLCCPTIHAVSAQ